jgi:voltage-gated sodium channel type II alpha
VALLVFDPFVELFITLCIVVNTLFMALDHYEMNKDMERALKSGNYVSCSNSYWRSLTPSHG